MIRTPAGGVGPGMGPDDEIRDVPAPLWTATVADLLAVGYDWFDSLHAIDEMGRPGPDGEVIRVVCRLVRWHEAGADAIQVHTRVPREAPVLDSLAEVAPGALWHEREAHDFFGVRFIGGDDAPLLFHQPDGVEPLRPMLKDAVLGARVVAPWPGSKDPEDDAQASRRRMSPAGVPDPNVWGEREVGDPANPDEVVAALSGGRVRRRR